MIFRTINLITKCNNCKELVKVKSNASYRAELSKKNGEQFNSTCLNCGTIQKKHVNDGCAKQDNRIILGAVLISIVATLVLLNILGAMGTITGIIPVLIGQQQSKSVHAFNRYMVSR